MAIRNIDALYEQYIRPLSPSLRLQVLQRIAEDMTHEIELPTPPRRAWREIRATAVPPLAGEDAQEWVTRSRQEDDPTY